MREAGHAEHVSPFPKLKHIAACPAATMPRPGGWAQERSCDLRTYGALPGYRAAAQPGSQRKQSCDLWTCKTCLATARLLKRRPVEPLPAPNSFYPRSEAQDHAGCFACMPGWTSDNGRTGDSGHASGHHPCLHQRGHSVRRRASVRAERIGRAPSARFDQTRLNSHR